MNSEDAPARLKQIIDRERADGCPMADESLIEPALRRWRSYSRRFRRHRDQSLAHRAHDLEKGLIALFPEHNYDPGCLHHLAESFAAELLSEVEENRESSHTETRKPGGDG
jgi:hypothetical protein